MPKRTFNLEKQLNENTRGGIMDVPHIALLRYMDPKQMVADFERAWGTKPTAVVLPITCPDGLLFPVTGLSDALSTYATNIGQGIRDFQDVVHKFSNLGLDIYLLLDPTLPFVDTAALHLVDIVGSGSAQTCFGNPRAQDVASAILGTAVDLTVETTKATRGKLKGVVLDVVDLWPMGGSNERMELTCFCPACERYFEHAQPGLVRKFKTFPNPWNLLLQATQTGISFSSEIRPKATAGDVVGLCRQRGFIKVFEGKPEAFLLQQAQDLLDYVSIRHNQTVSAVKEVFSQALRDLDSIPQRIILTEGTYHDWTSGLQLERLEDAQQDTNRPYDEIWFDPSSSELGLKHVNFRSYMWKRARYFLDAFFHYSATASDPAKRTNTGIARFTISQVRSMLNQRLNQALATSVRGYTTLASLPEMHSETTNSKRIGFVGVALTREVGEKFVEGILIPPGLADLGGRDDTRDAIDQFMKMIGKAKGSPAGSSEDETND